MENMILIGFMGTGKSTVGKAMASRLARPLVDIDQAIVSHLGVDIPTIFQVNGEKYFRDTETSILQQILMKKGQVVTTGGGAVLRAQNVTTMLSNGIVIALHASEDEIVKRVSSDRGRPLLAGNAKERVKTLLEERRGAYDFAHIHIDTTGKSVADIVEKIMTDMVEKAGFRRD